MNAIPETSRAS